MSKPKSSHRVFSREFKVSIVRRMPAGENVSALARELRFSRKDLYVWRDRFPAGGPEALRGRGRPPTAEAAGLAASGARAQAPGGHTGRGA
jgi:transposase-like protein